MLSILGKAQASLIKLGAIKSLRMLVTSGACDWKFAMFNFLSEQKRIVVTPISLKREEMLSIIGITSSNLE